MTMRKLLVAMMTAGGLLCGQELLAQPPFANSAGAVITYSAVNPAGACTNGRLWWNTATNILWICENGTWVSTLASASASFPITATSGATTVTLTGDAVAATGSYLLSNATQGGGWNTALGGALGASLFAFNATESASYSIDLSAQTATFLYTGSANTSSITLYASGGMNHNVTAADGSFSNINVGLPASVSIYAQDSAGNNASQIAVAQDQATLTQNIFDGTLHTAQVKLSGLRGISDETSGTKPTCDVSNRRRRWYVPGGAGVADTYEVCMKDAADVYAWKVLATP